MIKYLSLFSGIGAFEEALHQLQIPYTLIGFSELNEYAVQSYCAIHDISKSMNLGDIRKIDATILPKDLDLITYGFPCQDISLAGKQQGFVDKNGNTTRSGLFFEALRVLTAVRPKVAIAENVKNLTCKKFTSQFHTVLSSLESIGYHNYWQVLNAKDYGIPQNRERVFIVSIREDIDNSLFHFPEKVPLSIHLCDVLEQSIDEKYYLRKLPSTLTIDSENNCVRIKEATKKGYAIAYYGDSVNIDYPHSKTRRGRVGHGVAQTLTTSPSQLVVLHDTSNSLCVRKLTPRECFRLMGFTDADFDRAFSLNSETQLYKQAGNSIVSSVVRYIFEEIFRSSVLECE